jgi:predicted ATPase
MIIKEIHIEKFRAFADVSFKLGKRITAIAGRNATQKTTVLGMIGQPFSITQENNPMFGCKTIDGYDFKSQFSEKFKFSSREQAGEHRWTLQLYDKIHYQDGEVKDYFIAETISRNKTNGKLRIWNAEDKSHKAGRGFVQIPVYYLSLSRLYPIGEVSTTRSLDINLSEKEKEYCLRHYREILHIMDVEGTASMGVEVKNAKQKFAGVTDGKHDIFTNSAGEGNISRILLAMCSFGRLKDTYGDNYKGGILLIDELDATVYPYSQKKLVEYLFEAANDFNVQVVFTTHSPIVLESVIACQKSLMTRQHKGLKKMNQNIHDATIIYLESDLIHDGQITALNVNNNIELRKCINYMDLMYTMSDMKLHVYFEDAVAASLVEYLLKQYDIDSDKFFTFQELSLGWTQYVTLLDKNAFKIRDCMILLDADVPFKPDYSTHEKILKNSGNVIFLPLLVEEGLFKLLRDKNNYKIFEEKFLKNETLQYPVCFRDWPQDFEYYKKRVKKFKEWFKYVEKVVDRTTLFDFWLELNKSSANEFIKDFCKVYNELAERLKLDHLLPCPSMKRRRTNTKISNSA